MPVFTVKTSPDASEEGPHGPEDYQFEFPTPSATTEKDTSALWLRFIVTRYLNSPHAKSFRADRLWFILGRLRCLAHTLDQYNKHVVITPLPPIFTQYWKRRTLDLISGFGIQITNPSAPIHVQGLHSLIAELEKVFEKDIQANRELISTGAIVFDALAELYRPEVPVKATLSGLGGASTVFLITDCFYEERRSLMGFEKSFHFAMDYVVSLGNHFTVVHFTEVLSGWTGLRTRPIAEMAYIPVTQPTELEELTKRGAKYAELAMGGAKFLAYAGNTFFMHSNSTSTASNAGGMARSGSSQLAKGGRAMIDPGRGAALGHHASQGGDEPALAMVQLSSRYRRWVNTTATSSSTAASTSSTGSDTLILWDTVPPEMYIYCWPALVGFSFSAKVWGHILVTGIDHIQFNENAFDQLVLAEDRKQLIRALVRFGGEDAMDDIVAGKTGGSVFLLHGPPGVGKTLTAEAIAEVLHRPLYYVTMGELGLTPDDMEKRLSDVLDLCAGWDALTILDEADVFLEQRSTSDIVRNAMVCVMLRLLEYHPGILFLTTNRVKSFDPAFESRVTVALKYDSLAESARAKVWQNLLQRVNTEVDTEGISFEALAKHGLNGRQIKNSVRLAVALAREQKTKVTQPILESTLKITNMGREEMKTDESWKGT